MFGIKLDNLLSLCDRHIHIAGLIGRGERLHEIADLLRARPRCGCLLGDGVFQHTQPVGAFVLADEAPCTDRAAFGAELFTQRGKESQPCGPIERGDGCRASGGAFHRGPAWPRLDVDR